MCAFLKAAATPARPPPLTPSAHIRIPSPPPDAQNIVVNHHHMPHAPAALEEVVPQGWTKFGPDEEGDVWYVDQEGNSHWTLPGASTSV